MSNVILNNALGCLMNFMANYDDESVPVGEKYTNSKNVQKYYSEKISKPEVKDSKTITVKETKVIKTEESKPTSEEEKKEEVLTLPMPADTKKEAKSVVAQEKPKEEKAKAKPSATQEKVKVKPSKSEKEEEQKITVQARKSCPIKILSKEEKLKATKRNQEEKLDLLHDEGFHHLSHFINYLRDAGIQYSEPVKRETGLYEIIIQNNGRQLPISVDVDGLLYCDEIKFFIGQVRPGEEYIKYPILLTKEVLECLKNNVQIPVKYYITESLFNLNKVLDLQTLKEKDPKKREATFEHAAKAISDKDIYNAIVKAANGEPFRFAFCRYSSPEEFSIVSSKRNLSSNLAKDKLAVSKELWINYKDKKVDFSTKKAK